MAFPLFYVGPSAAASVLLRRYTDLGATVSSAVFLGVDYFFGSSFLHTFLFGGLFGLLWGYAYYFGSRVHLWLLEEKHPVWSDILSFRSTRDPGLARKMMFSGFLGAWVHVLFDAFIDPNISPFFPFAANPLFGFFTKDQLYFFSVFTLIIVIIYGFLWTARLETRST